MEAKITTTKDTTIEDLINKLLNEYRDEVAAQAIERDNLLAEGEALVQGSSETRAFDITLKMNKLKDHWQRLNEVAAARLKKLQEWLLHAEHELNAPLVYNSPDMEEIKAQLMT